MWSGVKNPLAQKHLHAIRKGDRVFYYHTGSEKSVAGIAKATSNAYTDPGDKSGKLAVVDLEPVGKLPRPVTLAEIKADKAFKTFPLVRIARLSVMPVTDEETIGRISGVVNGRSLMGPRRLPLRLSLSPFDRDRCGCNR